MHEAVRKHLPKKIKDQVKSKFGGRCAYCGEAALRLQVDHLIPLRHGGLDRLENLFPACRPCNNFKHTFSLEFFRKELEDQVNRARRYSVNFRNAERFGLISVQETKIKFYFEKTSDEN